MLFPTPKSSYAEALIPNVIVFGDGAFGRQLHLNEVIRGDPRHTKERPRGDTVRKWVSTNQEEGPHEGLSLLAP